MRRLAFVLGRRLAFLDGVRGEDTVAQLGRDTAAGKTFEAWVKKYWEKKAAGEKNIQIEPEKLD